MNFSIVTFLALLSPSRGILDNKNTRYWSYMSSERVNHHLLGCLLHSTDRMNARCTETFGLCFGQYRVMEVSQSLYVSHYLCTSFGLLLVHSQLDMCIHRNRKCWYNEKHTARDSEHTHLYLNKKEQNNNSPLSFKTITKKVFLYLCFSCPLRSIRNVVIQTRKLWMFGFE